MSTPIQIQNLVKTFGHARALDGLNLEVAAGEVHGFLGPNGAGKSTTLRILLGLLRSTSGDITLLGGDPWHQASELHSRLAYVPGDVALWPSLSGGEVLDLLARMRVGPTSQRRDELVERFQLDTKKKSRAYSKGNRQKVALISALEADVELLLLDEPTSGLDPIMEAEFRQYLANDRPAGQTVLLSSHILSEVEAACDRVTIINDGRTVESGSLAQMRHLSQTAVTAELDDPTLSVASLHGIHSAKIEGNVFTCTVESGHFDELLSTLAAHGVRNLVCSPPSLEELFLSHYQQLPANTK